jgi:hypothetical protein
MYSLASLIHARGTNWPIRLNGQGSFSVMIRRRITEHVKAQNWSAVPDRQPEQGD